MAAGFCGVQTGSGQPTPRYQQDLFRMQRTRPGNTWFLAQYKPNCHEIAERNLHRQDFQTFLPMHEETRRKSGRFITSLRPLFNGYLFVNFDTSKGGWQAVNNTYGITKLVSFANEPQSVPHDLVSKLMQRCDDEGKISPSLVFKAGDAVTLSGGPFSDFVATVEKVDADQRVWVLLDLMGRATRVVVQQDMLQVVSGAP
jgi:transcriptional antiterminator RfaH